MGNDLGYTIAVEQGIVIDAKSIKQRYYLVFPAKQTFIDEELDKLLLMRIIEPSKSAWSCPVLMAPKKDK